MCLHGRVSLSIYISTCVCATVTVGLSLNRPYKTNPFSRLNLMDKTAPFDTVWFSSFPSNYRNRLIKYYPRFAETSLTNTVAALLPLLVSTSSVAPHCHTYTSSRHITTRTHTQQSFTRTKTHTGISSAHESFKEHKARNTTARAMPKNGSSYGFTCAKEIVQL